ncbi:NYN domain-containing protein [Massilia sp. PAMC28688]|uniref:NYN domain-containing protein n=1 Tax=Massilia sp. PAMC28688 TaxID=2861283 RepID=UPI001C62E761|nr:NYN domain-containing protein [Massilia sp. PAMC28688]QYF92432.1 NYN domain-containing protein [Massilia sp. PAMC28688]
MASSNDNISMAVFCDFENVALGVRDANYEKFDIKPVLERLLLKGSIVVKKAYCDWERYKGFKATMHEANFELIEIPHVRQSGKNSADIRLVVDALDLCYTKSHVNTFVIISGDSDFSPLVSKLRENAKQVIGVGVKQSTSDLLVANCDEFIFYDDLVREVKRAAAKRDERKAPPARKSSDEGSRRKEEMESRKTQAIELVVEMFDALVSERGDSGKIWASLLKDTLKRRRPDFNETYYGFRTFGNLLEEAQKRGMLEFGRDEKSGAYVYRSAAPAADAAAGLEQGADDQLDMQEQPEPGAEAGQDVELEQREAAQDGADEPQVQQERQQRPPRSEPRRGRGRGGRSQGAVETPEPGNELPRPQGARQERQERQPRPARNDAQRGRGRGAHVPSPVDDVLREQQQHHLLEQQRERERDEQEQYEPLDPIKAIEPIAQVQVQPGQQERAEGTDARRGRGRGGRKPEAQAADAAPVTQSFAPPPPAESALLVSLAPEAPADADAAAPAQEKRRAPRKTAAKRAAKPAPATEAAPEQSQAEPAAATTDVDAAAKKPARRRPAKKSAE